MRKRLFDTALMARAAELGPRASVYDFMKRMPMARASGRPDDGWYQISAAKKTAKESEVTILIYGEIGFWGVTAADFVKDLQGVDVDVINLRINSPGGSVFDGIAIYNSLVQHKAKVVVHIDGWAASIASVIAMAGDEIRISEAATVMIHCPWSFVIGFAEDMRKEADVLDQLEKSICDVYVARTGGDRDEITRWMKDETWFAGEAAVDAGFADECVPLKVPGKETEDKAAAVAARLGADFFATIFPKMPADVKASLSASIKPPADEIGTEREFQTWLRANGFSGQRAKAITANGFKARSEPPGGADAADPLGGAAPPAGPTSSDRPGDADQLAGLGVRLDRALAILKS